MTTDNSEQFESSRTSNKYKETSSADIIRKESNKGEKQRLIATFNRCQSTGNFDPLLSATIDFARGHLYFLETEFRNLGTIETVDDFAQEIGISAAKRLTSIEGDGEWFYAWLWGAIKNQIIDFRGALLKQRRTKAGVTIKVNHEDGDEEIDNPEMYATQIRDHFITIPASVKGIDLDICHMMLERVTYYDKDKDEYLTRGLNYAEVAESLRISESTVKKRMQRLRSRLIKERELETAQKANEEAAAEKERRTGIDEGLRKLRASKLQSA